MDNRTLQTSSIKSSTEEIYDKTSSILTIINAHLDAKCPHCLELLKSGLENHSNTNTDDTTQTGTKRFGYA